jgi:PhnB protein
MQIIPYLNFDGECAAAFKFYEQCLGGKIVEMMKYGDSPMAEQTPPELRDKIMHVSLKVGDLELMGSDAPPSFFDKPQGFNVNLSFDNVAEAERVYHALAENGTIKMPLQESFWAVRWGMLIDRFGTPWMINCAKDAQ